MEITREELEAALKVMVEVVRSTEELKRVPTGYIYAMLVPSMSKSAFDSMIRQIVRTGVVREENNVLIWMGA